MKKIGRWAFAYCVNLESINLPKTIKKIGAGTFQNCESLKKIVIPKNVEEIGKAAFKECINLSKVVFKGTKCPEIDPGYNGTHTFYCTFKNTQEGLRFEVKTKTIAKELKAELKNSGVRKAKIYVGDKLIYKNVK